MIKNGEKSRFTQILTPSEIKEADIPLEELIAMGERMFDELKKHKNTPFYDIFCEMTLERLGELKAELKMQEEDEKQDG